MIGSILDKYEVLQKIGEGGMATVYRGRHTTLGRDVAIKVLHPHLSSTERNRTRFAREAEAIERLNHENILKILDYSGSSGDSCYIVTEFIEGVTLRDLLHERQKIPSEIVAQIGVDLLQALHYAHSLGLVHRDLKPENVMLRQDGTIKLMDFGIARFIDESQLTVTGTLIGSPAYMSPEQAMEKSIDSRSDLFSLGTLLFHLTCGELPFRGSNPSVVLRNIIENNYSPPLNIAGEISHHLSDLLEDLLQTEPDSRISDPEEIIKRLQNVLDEGGIDLTNSQWQLRMWLSDPEGYEIRLQEHLTEHLLAQGKRCMANGDHLGAHKHFNRLLSMDEDNPQVVELIQIMYNNDDEKPLVNYRWWFALPLCVVGLLTFFLWPSQQTDNVTTAKQITKRQVPVTSLLPDTETTFNDILPPESEQPTELPQNNTIAVPTPPKIIKKKTKPLAIKERRLKNPSGVKIAKKSTDKAAKKKTADSGDVATLVITVPNSWADIWIDGKPKGRTGSVNKIYLTPGTHELRLENKFALPYRKTITLAPGEVKEMRGVHLQRKPATLIVPRSYDSQCIVSIDQVKLGSLQKLKYRLSIKDPSTSHKITLRCNQKIVAQRKVSPLTPGGSFPLVLQ